ncbi:MAG: sulfatase-like hydrolase/transferase [Vicinamibacterales bacterium]|nr:sulfatase-like hydrolase/transferase [Vicinamibacterales bacterium]
MRGSRGDGSTLTPGHGSRRPLNLVIITLDTTRADHVGAYGSRDVETPALDRLAREGVLFEQAMTSAPLTLPAHASILTGRFPPEHGVRDNGGFFLGPDQTTLAEILGPQGFKTGGFVAAYVLDSKWGIGQGFDTYVDDFDVSKSRGRSLGEIQRPANEVVDKALPWIDTVKDGPFFAWLHFYDPHTPYAPPEPYRTKYKGHPYRGEVAFTDSQVGRVVEFLESRGLLEHTVIAVLGDHGESLGDHGEDAHGFFIYEAATHVPFIIRAPLDSARGRRVADPVRVVDLLPTALDLMALPAAQQVAGKSLVPLMTGAAIELGLEGYAEAMYPLHHYGWSDLRAMRSGRFKVIDAPRPELYDIETDPGEQTDIYQQRRAVGDQMITRLRAIEQSFEKVSAALPPSDIDPEVRARLAALGYVGSFVATANDPRTARPDPKDKIPLFNLLGEARDLAPAKGSFAAVTAILRKVLAEDPQVIDGWFSLGNAYFKERRHKEAIEYFRRALALKPDYDLAVINIAAAYRQLGDDDAALAGFEHYLTIDPKDSYVRYQMGEIWLDRGDLDRAEKLFREALEMDDHVAPAKNALGAIAFKRGELESAGRLAREALELRSDVRLAHYNLAQIAEARGDLATAEREYLEELDLHPETYKAAFNLSRVYAQMGEKQLEMDAIRQALDGNPRFADGHFFLARALMASGGSLEEAASLARKGLDLDPKSEMAPLGHYVLADIYNRRGQPGSAAREVALARSLEAKRPASR